MAVAASTIENRSSFYDIPENNKASKLLCCIPIFGLICSVINEFALREQLRYGIDINKAIKIIHVINDYKKAGIVSGLLTIALVIASLSIGLFAFDNLIALFLAQLSGALIGRNIVSLCVNACEAQSIRETGSVADALIM